VKVLPKRFQLNGHTIGFRPQTQKLNLHLEAPIIGLGSERVINSIVICLVLIKNFNFSTAFLNLRNLVAGREPMEKMTTYSIHLMAKENCYLQLYLVFCNKKHPCM